MPSPDGRRVRPDPWRGAPVGELQDQLLPRWFVLLGLASVAAAAVAIVAAFVVFGPDDVPVARRRPPPAGGLTTAVGDHAVGPTQPQPLDPPCDLLAGVQAAGEERDRDVLRAGLGSLCEVSLPQEVAARVAAFARAGGTVRFAQFEATGVDSAALLDADPPLVLVNARLASSEQPAWVAPLLIHDVTVLAGEPGTVATALDARRAEADVCARLFERTRPSRGCDDAASLLALPDPEASLREAGFR